MEESLATSKEMKFETLFAWSNVLHDVCEVDCLNQVRTLLQMRAAGYEASFADGSLTSFAYGGHLANSSLFGDKLAGVKFLWADVLCVPSSQMASLKRLVDDVLKSFQKPDSRRISLLELVLVQLVKIYDSEKTFCIEKKEVCIPMYLSKLHFTFHFKDLKSE